MSKPFDDRYGRVADNYLMRPAYPTVLFDWLAQQVSVNGKVWDCACGSGQMSYDLANRFAHVIATDASAEQIKRTKPDPRIEFRQAAAELSGIADKSVDLITVGMAAHWFDLGAFYAEARRVIKPGGILALLAYGEPHIADPAADSVLQRFIQSMQSYGVPERRDIDSGYSNLFFPFPSEIKLPAMSMQASMTLAQFFGYMRSRSAVMNFTRQNGHDPVLDLEQQLLPVWGNTGTSKQVQWPLMGRVARLT